MSHHFPLVSGTSGPDLLDQDSLSYNITILLLKVLITSVVYYYAKFQPNTLLA